MRFRFTVLVLVFALAIQANAAKIVFGPNNKVVVDGKANEWPNPLPNFDKKTTLRFDVSNDEKSLYFILRVDDLELQKKIMTNGMDIWINRDGKQATTTGITYPCPMEKTETGSGNDVFIIDSLILSGFYLENGKQSIFTCPIKVAIAKGESSCMIYEVSVPFNSFWKEKIEKSDTKKNFQIGFVIKGAALPANMLGGFPGASTQSSSRSSSRSSGNANMMGMMMGGDMPPGAASMMRNMSRNMKDFLPAEYQDKAYWFKAQLNNSF
jgi:hypothetical protein